MGKPSFSSNQLIYPSTSPTQIQQTSTTPIHSIKMLARTIIAFALASVSSAAAVKRTDPPVDCSTRDDGFTTNMFCAIDTGDAGISIPIQACNLVADPTLGLNVASCCNEASCINVGVL